MDDLKRKEKIDKLNEICKKVNNLAECGTYGKRYVTQLVAEVVYQYINLLEDVDDIDDGWTSIDNPPIKDGSYLICTKKGSVCTARFYTSMNKFSSRINDSVILWMPLPKPPSYIDTRKEYK